LNYEYDIGDSTPCYSLVYIHRRQVTPGNVPASRIGGCSLARKF